MQTPPGGPPGAREESRAQLIVRLVRAGLTAPDVPSAVQPALETFVALTAAEGAAYFQAIGDNFLMHARTGVMPHSRAVGALTTHDLPIGAPLLRALTQSSKPLFFSDTRRAADVASSAEAGVAGLAAAPVTSRDGKLLGAFLMYTTERHRWKTKERGLFATITETLGALVARLLAEEDAIRALGMAVEGRDPEVKGHIERVTALAERVSSELGLHEATLVAIRLGAYLHDLGKLGTPDAILHKPGRLDAGERKVMQQHAEAGHQVAQQLTFLPQAALDIVLYHHERWDGTGYPRGLKEVNIPLAARIFAVCDVYDALTSERPYKRAWSHQSAVTEIRLQGGRQFDPRVVTAFLSLSEALQQQP